ncbi:fungal-specific transcription factor domain-containing protein [Xylariaceae sp. FL0255]|nr:fungal-specific transcription factor domain-containing protein [Xylariaceae sp. FL0255]
MKAGRSCWTCKERKISCDQGLPECAKCVRGHRECQGYQPRLSWPRINDTRRAMTSDQTENPENIHRTDHHLFINTTYQDLEFHRHSPFVTLPCSPGLQQWEPQLRRQPLPRIENSELVQYFQEVAHLALVTFNDTSVQIRDTIMHMTLTSDTAPAQALMCALLAFSSLHRNGLQPEAIRLKIAALQALSSSAREAARSPTQASQHIATCMLLCAFEILLPLDSSGDWLWYINGALEIVQNAGLREESGPSHVANLLEWVYYHDTLSRFTTCHWRNKNVALEQADTTRANLRGNQFFPLPRDRPRPRSGNPTYAVLDVLSDVCDTLVDPSDPRSQEDAYLERLKTLEWRVNNLPNLPPTTERFASPPPDMSMAASLYQIATMVYLVRASHSSWGPSANLDYLVDKILATGMHEPTCRHVFPLFILALEARTEEHRASVLDLIARTQKESRSRYLDHFKTQILTFWKQQDLQADSDLLLNYQGLMKAVINSNNALPSFV